MQKEATIRSAMGSTAIEGYVLSLPEVKALAQGKPEMRNLSSTERAVVNYLSALSYIQKESGSLISHDLIYRLHKIIAEGASEKGTTPGKYRNVQNYVVNGLGQVIYKPPTPKDVSKLMNSFVKYVNIEAEEYLPIISSGIVHYNFVSIHPFVDGNGRLARLLGTWELIRRKFDTEHIFSIDDIIYEHKAAYYSALQSVQGAQYSKSTDKDLTPWLEFYLEVMAESLTCAWQRIIRIPTDSMSEQLSLTPKQEKLVNLLKDSGNLSSKDLAKALKITVQGVHFILKPLIKAKIIKRRGGKKTGAFGLS
ncbi:MAG: Fic family protein [Elusimicrobia bacterium]|nr:Fic family protein [Elusimicrobiota bacterium]MBU2614636.1 Fic family protein [Elusimicrobiota bacterium]